MMIDVPRLRQSDFDAATDDTAWRAGFNLWFSAWESTPAGSLRADDASLAKAAGIGRDMDTWARVKSAAMQGFTLCSDGRVYHATVCTNALGVWIDKLIRRHAGQKGNNARYGAHADIGEIERQIVAAGDHLFRLDPLAPAIAKVGRYRSHCESQSDHKAGALPSQYNEREGNGPKSPSQEGPRVVSMGAGR